MKLKDQTGDMKDKKDPYGRLMVLVRSNRDINQKNAIGNYEFTLTLRAMFAPGGTVLLCLLIRLARNEAACMDHQVAMETGNSNSPSRKIALVDGMLFLQRLTEKPGTVVTVNDLSVCFNDRLMSLTQDSLTQDSNEIVLVFDTYRANSLRAQQEKSEEMVKLLCSIK